MSRRLWGILPGSMVLKSMLKYFLPGVMGVNRTLQPLRVLAFVGISTICLRHFRYFLSPERTFG